MIPRARRAATADRPDSPSRRSRLRIARRPGESIDIGGRLAVRVAGIHRDRVRLVVTRPADGATVSLTSRLGDALELDGGIEIAVVEIRGRRVGLVVSAPVEIRVRRAEVPDAAPYVPRRRARFTTQELA